MPVIYNFFKPLGVFSAVAVGFVAMVSGAPIALADTVEKIKSDGKVVIGFREDTRPFSFVDVNGVPAGYSIDICLDVVDEVRSALGNDDIKVEYKQVTSDNRFDMVESGEVDIVCGATTNTLTRQEKVSFTLMTFITGAEMLLTADTQIQKPADLAGKTLGVLHGTTTEDTLGELISDNGLDTKIVTYDNHDDGMAALTDGSVDGYFGDRVLLILMAMESENPANYKLSGRYYSHEPYALVVRRNDDSFRLMADRAIADIYRTGKISEIYRKWFGNAKPGNLLQALFVLNAIPE